MNISVLHCLENTECIPWVPPNTVLLNRLTESTMISGTKKCGTSLQEERKQLEEY